LGILVLILALWILIQTTFFQNFIIHKVAHRLSKDLNTTVTIKKIDLELFDKMSMQGLLVLDRKKDTLLYAGAANVNITDWFFFKKNITLNYIGLTDALVNLNRTDSVWNYQFLIDYFSGSQKKKSDTSSTTINLGLKVLNLKNMRIWQKDEWRGENILFSISKLNIHTDEFDINNRVIRINQIQLENPEFSLYDYTGNAPQNTSIAPDTLVTKIKGFRWNPDGWRLSANQLSIKNGLVAIESEGGSPPTINEFDASHIILSGVNGTFKNVSLLGDTLQSFFSISAKDRGGFTLKNIAADFKFTPVTMEFKGLNILTNKSHLQNYFALHYKNFNDDMQDFVHSVVVDGRFKNSKLSSDDLAYFAPETRSWKTDFTFSGNAHGTIDNLVARDMVVTDGNQNYLNGNISLRGLPDINKTFVDFRTNDLRTSYSELSKLIPSLKSVTHPNLSAFGNIKFSGSYTGYINDFVAYGTLITDLGVLQTDLHLSIPNNGESEYDGKVSTTNFQLGKFINNSDLGNIVFNGKIKGKGFNANNLDLGVDGNISKISKVIAA
jgi:hypothetical protein